MPCLLQQRGHIQVIDIRVEPKLLLQRSQTNILCGTSPGAPECSRWPSGPGGPSDFFPIPSDPKPSPWLSNAQEWGGKLLRRPRPAADPSRARRRKRCHKARIPLRAAVAQLARASACHAEGRGFESHQPLRESPAPAGLLVIALDSARSASPPFIAALQRLDEREGLLDMRDMARLMDNTQWPVEPPARIVGKRKRSHPIPFAPQQRGWNIDLPQFVVPDTLFPCRHQPAASCV